MFVKRDMGEPTDDAQGVSAAPRSRPDELPIERLEAELCELAAHLEAGMARWISLVAEYDRRGGWSECWGVRSTAEWIAWRCSCSPRAAREHVRVARALRELPKIREMFASGELSYSKVRPLTRVAAVESEADLIQIARDATASQLERMLHAFERSTVQEANQADQQRELSWLWGSDGCLHLKARVPAEEGRALLVALEAARAQIREQERAGREEDGSAEPQDASLEKHADVAPDGQILLGRVARNADALSLMCESFMAKGSGERPGPERQHVVVHIDAETLARDGEGRSSLDDGPSISPETARRLGCDGSLQAITKRGRKVLCVGRKTRAVSPAMNMALRERDKHCRFPGCENRRWVDSHHIVHWARGGETSLENLVLLCRRHHRLVHEGAFSVARRPDGELVFRNPQGKRLVNSPKPAPGDHREVRRRNRTAGLEIGAETILHGTGERMNLAGCVDAVIDATRPTHRPP
jgi:hypothetical protein